MEVEPEVSRLDASSGATIAGALVPGRATQRVRTAVMIEDGQTLAIGGLIQNEVTASITKVPMIGDLPFLGPLFSTKSYPGNRDRSGRPGDAAPGRSDGLRPGAEPSARSGDAIAGRF